MKVLHVLSQVEMTGAEAYAVTLSEWLIDQGCEVHIVSNRLHTPTRAPFTSRDIHGSGWWNRLQNILFLRRFIQENKIKVVHCGARRLKLVHFATHRLERR